MALTGPEREMFERLRLDVAKAAEREVYNTRDMERLETRLVEKIDEVEGECVGFRKMAVKRWEEEDRRRQQRAAEKNKEDGEERRSKRGLTVAWIGGGFIFAGVIVQTVASLFGGGG